MNAEFFEALAMLEAERGLSAEYLLEKIKNAIVIAVKKDYDVEDDNVAVEIDPETGKFNVNLLKHIVEEVENPNTEISLEDALAKKKTSKVGTDFIIPLKTKDFGRIAAQTAKHVIRQGLKEAERQPDVCRDAGQHARNRFGHSDKPGYGARHCDAGALEGRRGHAAPQ